jgi:LysM repeat protein
MKAIRELLIGMLTAIASIIVVMGGITLSVAQEQPVTLSPTIVLLTNTLSPSPTSQAIVSPTVTSEFYLVTTATFFPVATSTATEFIPTTCPPPTGWQQYVVPGGTSLDNLARAHGITVDRLMEANCLVNQNLMPDIILYLPPVKSSRKPTNTERPVTNTPEPTLPIKKVTPVPCGQPHGWVDYYMQAGDTLYHLGMIFNTTAMELQRANCLLDSSFIYTGQRLYVPILFKEAPTDFPTQAPPSPHKTNARAAAATPLPTCTSRPTQTPSSMPADNYTPTYVPSLTSTNTLTFTPTTKPYLSPTDTPVP